GAEVASVRAGVHPEAAADRARDRGGELEAAEPGVARAVETHGIRGAAAGDDRLSLDPHCGELAHEPQDERVDALVVHEHVRAEADRLGGMAVLRGPGDELPELLEARRLGVEPRRPARADRRVASEPDPFGDLHPRSRPRSSAGARSTSPAPIVSTTSPGSA